MSTLPTSNDTNGQPTSTNLATSYDMRHQPTSTLATSYDMRCQPPSTLVMSYNKSWSLCPDLES